MLSQNFCSGIIAVMVKTMSAGKDVTHAVAGTRWEIVLCRYCGKMMFWKI
jgi:hypothetical protein